MNFVVKAKRQSPSGLVNSASPSDPGPSVAPRHLPPHCGEYPTSWGAFLADRALGEESVTLEDICEPYLMQMGMLTRTPRGRCVTRLAYEHLHMAVPKRFDDEDSGQTSMF